jgi:glutamine phosphoribosylpyrophosphate amidotransferase
MCGLVGVFGEVSLKVENVFEDMLRADILRGWNSTGVCAVNRHKDKSVIVKDVLRPEGLLWSKEYKKRIKNQFNKLLMGHNRAATSGKVNKENAHPFKRGHISLGMNGTLTGQWRLPDYEKFNPFQTGKTDSENIAHAIQKNGAEETYKLIDGAATLTWWDSRKGKLFFLSNGEREFSYGFLKHTNTLVWASEDMMLRWCVDRREMDFRNDETFEIKPNTLMSFKWNEGKKAIEREQHALEEIKFFEDYKYPTRIHHGYVPADTTQPLLPWHMEDMQHALSRDAFLSRYENCMGCYEKFEDANLWLDAIIVSDTEAACFDCSNIANPVIY